MSLKPNGNYRNLKDSYLFFRIAQKVAAYRDAHPGLPIYRLGIGDVSRPLGDAAIRAMHEAVEDQAKAETFHGYTPECGIPEFRQAVAGYYARRGIRLDPEEIFVSSGASDELGDILDLFDASSAALITQPAYPAYVDASVMAGRKVSFLTAGPDNDFLPLPGEDTEADLVYLCSPNNPTGAVYSLEQLQAWVDFANARSAVILFDAAYEAFVEGDLPHSIFETKGAETCPEPDDEDERHFLCPAESRYRRAHGRRAPAGGGEHPVLQAECEGIDGGAGRGGDPLLGRKKRAVYLDGMPGRHEELGFL